MKTNITINDFDKYNKKEDNDSFQSSSNEFRSFLFPNPWGNIIKPKNLYYSNFKYVFITPNINYKVLNKKFSLPIELNEIYEQVIEASELFKLNDNWDDNCGEKTDKTTLLNAISFVTEYSLEIFNKFEKVIIKPYIDISPDGSIYVHYENYQTRFLIIFKKTNKNIAYYYGERMDNNIPLKSAIDINKGIDEILVLWMKKYLVKN